MEHDSYDSMEVFFCLLLYLEMYRLQYVPFASKSVSDNLHGMCRCSRSSFCVTLLKRKEKFLLLFFFFPSHPTSLSLSPPLFLSLTPSRLH